MKQLIASVSFILIVSFVTAFTGSRSATGEGKVDSLPKYHYVVRLEIPAGQYSTSIDTLYMIMGELGKTLTVDQANQYRNLADRQLYRIAQYGKIDSVKIETKGGKP
jgi:hypothetical protein